METNNNIPADGWDEFIKPLTVRGINWSTTNGNHDPFDENIYLRKKSILTTRIACSDDV